MTLIFFLFKNYLLLHQKWYRLEILSDDRYSDVDIRVLHSWSCDSLRAVRLKLAETIHINCNTSERVWKEQISQNGGKTGISGVYGGTGQDGPEVPRTRPTLLAALIRVLDLSRGHLLAEGVLARRARTLLFLLRFFLYYYYYSSTRSLSSNLTP